MESKPNTKPMKLITSLFLNLALATTALADSGGVKFDTTTLLAFPSNFFGANVLVSGGLTKVSNANGSISISGGGAKTNENQFGATANGTITIASGAALTNANAYGLSLPQLVGEYLLAADASYNLIETTILFEHAQRLLNNPNLTTNLTGAGTVTITSNNAGSWTITGIVTNSVTLIASNSITAQLDFSTTPDYVSTDVMRANLSLQLTNLVQGRTVTVYLTGDTNANQRTVTVSTNGMTGANVVRWNFNSPTNGTSDFTVTNGMRAELSLKCVGRNSLGTNEVWAIWGPVR